MVSEPSLRRTYTIPIPRRDLRAAMSTSPNTSTATASATMSSTSATMSSHLYGTAGALTNSSVPVGSMMTGQIAVPNLAQLVTVRLSRENHFLWKAQIVPILRGHQLLGFVTSESTPPVRLVPASTAEGAEMVINPAHTVWNAQDQLLLAGILSTLSPDVLARTLNLTTSPQIWAALERMFAS